MKPLILYPSRRYLLKLYLGTLCVLLVLLPILLLMVAFLTSGRATLTPQILLTVLALWLALVVVVFIGVTWSYVNRRYEIYPHEIRVIDGVLNRAIRRVPFRTITHLAVLESFWDRWFGIGVLEIQTSENPRLDAPELRLVGLNDIHNVHARITEQLRQTQGGVAPLPDANHQDLLLQLMNEVRTLRAEVQRLQTASLKAQPLQPPQW